MKNFKWVGLVVSMAVPICCACAQTPVGPVSDGSSQAPVTAPSPVTLSPAAAEVVRLALAGTTDDVLVAYIQNSPGGFGLSADNILYLKDVGLSSAVTSAMLNRDAALRGQPQTYNYNQAAYAPTIPPPASPAPTPAPAPEPTAPAAPIAAPVAAAASAPVYVSSRRWK